MCGVAGLLVEDEEASPRHEATVEHMVDQLLHRGPDGHGVHASGPIVFGHTRLAIIDPHPRGLQPFVSPDGRYVLSFNGEIYNYRELRSQLSRWRFRTDGDTEVLLAAWAAAGVDCLPRLRGMFAFALWDAVEQRLFLVRDRFGIKPLYYGRLPGGGVAFASEIAPVRSAGVVGEPCPRRVLEFIDSGRVEGDGTQTFFHGIAQVAAGSYVTFSREGTSASHRYYSLPASMVASPECSAGEFVKSVAESVTFHLRSDVTVGSCLSGGIDSTTVVSMCRDQLEEQGAQVVFTAGSEQADLDEREYARAAAQRLGIRIVETIPTGRGLVEDLPSLIRAQGEPFPGSGIYAQWCVMRAAAGERVKVMLDGQGADELLGGYSRHRLAWALDEARHGSLGRAGRGLMGAGSPLRLRHDLLPAAWAIVDRRTALRRHRRETGPSSASRDLQAGCDCDEADDGKIGPTPIRSQFDRERLQDVAWRTLPGILRYEDRNSMKFGIEARVPYVDHLVAERAMSIPAALLFERGFSKSPLRTYLQSHQLARIAGRVAKLGYATPEQAWFQGTLGNFAREVLTDSSTVDSGLFNPDVLPHLVGQARERGSTGQAWRTLCVALWYRWVVAGDSFSPSRKLGTGS